MEIIWFSAKFFVSAMDSRHLGEMKTSTNDEKSGEQGTFQFFWNGERSL